VAMVITLNFSRLINKQASGTPGSLLVAHICL
jgi:hypothetical protein